MQLDVTNWTLTALIVVVVVNTALIAVAAAALYLIHRRLDELSARLEPLLLRSTETLKKVEQATGDAGQRVVAILDRTSEVVERVGDRVDGTSAVAAEAISGPLIGAAGLAAAIQRGLDVYAEEASRASKS